MLKRVYGNLTARNPADAPGPSLSLERDGFVLLEAAFSAAEVDALHRDVTRVFEELPADGRNAGLPPDEDDMFRYEMFNRSEVCQQAVANPRILSVIEPLLGEDCHIIANTAWRNPAHHPATHGGQAWHVDGGPHVPLPKGVAWPEQVPHPVFAVGAHIFLQDCGVDDGPTGVIPGSHLSGRFPPGKQLLDDDLQYNGVGPVRLLASAGDVALFVSDVWHRRMPCGDEDQGRFFLQVHYARRDIAQRIRPTSAVNHLSEAAQARASEPRMKTLIGLHPKGFYDG